MGREEKTLKCKQKNFSWTKKATKCVSLKATKCVSLSSHQTTAVIKYIKFYNFFFGNSSDFIMAAFQSLDNFFTVAKLYIYTYILIFYLRNFGLELSEITHTSIV